MRSCLKLLVCLLVAAGGQAAVEPGKLACGRRAFGPFLDFGFRYVSGIHFSVPAKQFWGSRLALEIETVVEPVGGTPGTVADFVDTLQTAQSVPVGIKGQIEFSSAFSTGVGDYRATWTLRDRLGRTCEQSRLFKVGRSKKHQGLNLTLQPGEIVDTAFHLFRREPIFERLHLRSPARLKVFISMDVLGRRRRVVRPRLIQVLPHFATLRQLVRSQGFNEFSLVVFSFEDQKVLVRQDYAGTVDFSLLRGVVDELQPETVDVNDLARGSQMQFFERMLSEELLSGPPADGVVFVGQEMEFGKRVPERTLAAIRQTGSSFAFFDASRFAWRGAMGNLVRAMNGREYMLRDPTDLARAISGFESQILMGRPQ